MPIRTPMYSNKSDGESSYNQEELYTSEADKASLQNLSELEREGILYGRYQNLKKFKEKQELREKAKYIYEKSHNDKARESLYIHSNMNTVSEAEKQTTASEEDFEVFKKLIIPRNFLLENSFKPFFDEFIGHYVKVLINKEYFICRIEDVSKGKPYVSPLDRKSNLKINKYIKITTRNRTIKQLCIEYVSNSPITFTEFEAFYQVSKLPSLKRLAEKHTLLKANMGRRLNEDEISKVILERERCNPKKKSKAQIKIGLIAERESAILGKNSKLALEIQKKIEELEDQDAEDPLWYNNWLKAQKNRAKGGNQTREGLDSPSNKGRLM